MKRKVNLKYWRIPCLETVLWCRTTLVCKEGVYIPSRLNDFPSEKNLNFFWLILPKGLFIIIEAKSISN